MENNAQVVLETFLIQLIGKPTWGVAIGPSGIHVHFGDSHPRSHPNGTPAKPTGDYSIWVRGAIKITDKQNLLWEGWPLENDKNRSDLAGLIANKTVSKATVDYQKNILQIELNEEALFSAYPLLVNSDEFPWMVYDHLKKPTPYVVVKQHKIEVFNIF